MNTKKGLLVLMTLGAFATIDAAHAAPLRSGFGGAEGYGQLSQSPNDDGSSNQLNLPFQINFFGNNFNKFYVNNNGNISFNSPIGTYTPRSFPIASQPMIAPFWGDVDTRNQPGGGAVYVASPDANTLVVTWHDVGYYNKHNDKINDFQMTLLNRADTGAGNFDIEFRYNQLQWTTGDVSYSDTSGMPSGGLGGVPAQAGYDAGDRTHFYALPGSFTSDILNLVNTSNVSQETPGIWTMAIRNGTTSDGSSASAPVLPTIVQDDGYHFNFNVNLNQQVYIDPQVAVGYDYHVTSGPNIASVMLPVLAGNTDGYQLYDLSGNLLANLLGGQTFNFGAGGVTGFRVLGIDTGVNLDPANSQAFVTALSFTGTGAVSMTQDPITVETGSAVPEPASILLLGLGGCIGLAARRRRGARA